MTHRTSGRLLVIILVVALAAALPLAYQLRGLVRQSIVIPAMYLLWQVGVLAQSVDSLIYWAAFLALALALFWHSLKGQRRQTPVRHSEERETADGRVAFWAGQITKAENSTYALWQMQRELAQIAAEIQAHGQPPPVGQAAQIQAIGSMDAPHGVQSFLNAGLDRPLSQSGGCRALFGGDLALHKQSHTIEHLQTTIAFLEDRVEAGYGGGHHADIERE